MVFKDFREYLQYLEKNKKLVEVKEPVDTRFDIAAGIRKTSDIDGPALLFENIKGHPGWRVAGGVYATQKLTALALGLPVDATEQQMVDRYLMCQNSTVKPKVISTGPVKEIIIKGDDVDLSQLPVPTYSEKDGGPFLTAGIEIGKHPDLGFQNASIHRRMVLSKDKSALLARPYQHLGAMIVAAHEKGHGLGVATVMGADPSVTIASQVKAPYGVDEIEIAGTFRGAPIEVVKCETIDALVPANAEVVIEGVTIPGEKVVDGPFGEFPGNYISLTGVLGVQCPVVKVTAITMRKDPIFQAMLTGMPMTENHCLKKWALTAALLEEVKRMADVRAINVTAGGTAQFHVIVSIKKKAEADGRHVIYSLFGSRIGPKQVIIVDDDIDVYNPFEVEWAVATRVRPDKDIIIAPAVEPMYKDEAPQHMEMGVASKYGIDATMPLQGSEYFRKIHIPGIEKIKYI